MAHLNLVLVHPFRDGNGRMARCLQTLVLARDGIHKAAARLIATVQPEGADLARSLRIALEAKDPMHSSTDYLAPDRHAPVLRAATTLATAARRMLPSA